MEITGREVIDVIEKISSLDWFRYPNVDYLEERLKIPPVVVWRFDPSNVNYESAKRVTAIVKDVINRYRGNVDWSFKAVEKNWVLMPTRIQELEESGQYRTDGEILMHLAKVDPIFGKDAYSDLLVIASEISRRLGDNQLGKGARLN